MMLETIDHSMKIFEQKCNISVMKKKLHDGQNPIGLDMPIGGLPPTALNIKMTKNVDSTCSIYCESSSMIVFKTISLFFPI